MIGNRGENNETILDGAIRECTEEFGHLKIHTHIFMYEDVLEGELKLSDEIENFMWFEVDDDRNILSNTLKNEIIPYVIENGSIYSVKKDNRLFIQ